MTTSSLRTPTAVIISDIHFNLNTVELAKAALLQAIKKAALYNVPLVIAGDLHDTKANLRGECINAMLDTLSWCTTPTYILVGNHDRINESSSEHALNFLQFVPNVELIDKVSITNHFSLVPYHHDLTELEFVLAALPDDVPIIMHQGLQGALSGEYILDKTAISKDMVAGRRIISGHYHVRQHIELPDGGLWTYIGNPFTLNFGEAEDPSKGFLILRSDETVEFVPTSLRKHVKIIKQKHSVDQSECIKPGDLVWVKISGSREFLASVTREGIQQEFKLPDDNFKLTLTPDDAAAEIETPESNMTQLELLASLVNKLCHSPEQAARLTEFLRSL